MHHQISSCGVEGELKDLETGEVFDNFAIKAILNSLLLSPLREIDGESEYWQPVVANHTPSDSYVLGKGLILQMSVAESHEINVEGVEDLLDNQAFAPRKDANGDERIKFLFVRHSDVANKYGLQNLKSTKKGRAMNVNNRIKQYSFTVDLEERLQILRNRTQSNSRGSKRKVDCVLGDEVTKRQKIN